MKKSSVKGRPRAPRVTRETLAISEIDRAVVRRLHKAVGDHMRETGELLRWKEVARRGGLTAFIVSDIINARRRIMLEDIPRLARGVGVREVWLVFEEEPMRDEGYDLAPGTEDIPMLPSIPVGESRGTRVAKSSRRHEAK